MPHVRVDLHLHTSASFDCEAEPDRVLRRCQRLGLAPVFLTDHDTMAGFEDLRQRRPDAPLVGGQEVTTLEGEIIGLFLSEPVPAGLEPEEAVARIHAQGGLVYLEHPGDRFRRSLGQPAIERIASAIDIVEVFNARSDPEANGRAQELCAILGAAPGAGSDAHTLREIGAVQVELEAFAGPRDFLAKLRASVIRRPSRLRRGWRFRVVRTVPGGHPEG